MGKPNLKNMLLVIIGLMASLIFITKAIVPWMVNPVKEWERKATDRKNKINSLQKTQKTADLYRKRLAKLNTQGFASSQAEASASMGEHITGLIRQSGLSETAFSRRPFEPRAIVKNGPKPVGYTVNGQGSLKKVTDLIYLLQNDPHIHRVENISLSPVSGSTDVRVNFQFLSLVIGTQYGKFTGTNAPPVFPALDSKDRSLYAGITKRALFLPYQKQPPPPPPPPAKPKSKPPSSPPPPGPETYKIVSLSEWQGEQEVMVFDTNKNKTNSYKLGDDLAGGTIVMIDYRQMPFPEKPALLSQSRVILSIEDDFWAIERGNTFADKHKLAPEKLPERLAKREL